MIRTATILVASLLLIAPGIGASEPDHADADGDLAAGPVGIVGVSTDSGSRTFVFDLHVDALDLSAGNVRYTWDFRIDGSDYQWSCDAFQTYNGPRIDCQFSDLRQDAVNRPEAPHPVHGRVEALDGTVAVPDPRSDGVVPATHHLDLEESTVGFTLAYDALDLQKGDAITLVGGKAHFTKPHPSWIGAPADAMILGQDVILD